MILNPSVPLNVGDPRYVNIYLVGCGGTGSYLAQRLARLAGHAAEMDIEVHLTLIDHDKVERKNLWRQLFVAGEIGQYKAQALANRYARSFGLPIRFHNEKLRPGHIVDTNRYRDRYLHIIAGCVDNTRARRGIEAAVKGWSGRLWWLDCGNWHHHGQVALGNRSNIAAPLFSALGYCTDLPLPSVAMPEIVAEETQPTPLSPVSPLLVPPIAAPSLPDGLEEQGREANCAIDTLENIQGLMVNETVAGFAAHYLYRLIISRDLDTWITYFNLQAGNARSVYITPAMELPAVSERETVYEPAI